MGRKTRIDKQENISTACDDNVVFGTIVLKENRKILEPFEVQQRDGSLRATSLEETCDELFTVQMAYDACSHIHRQ